MPGNELVLICNADIVGGDFTRPITTQAPFSHHFQDTILLASELHFFSFNEKSFFPAVLLLAPLKILDSSSLSLPMTYLLFSLYEGT